MKKHMLDVTLNLNSYSVYLTFRMMVHCSINMSILVTRWCDMYSYNIVIH